MWHITPIMSAALAGRPVPGRSKTLDATIPSCNPAVDVPASRRPALLNATIIVAVASGTLYFLGSVNDASFLRSLGLPASSFTSSPEELLRLGSASILGFLIDWWLSALVVGVAAALHATLLATNAPYADFWRQGLKTPRGLTATVVGIALFVLVTNQAVLDGERRASGPVVQRLDPFEFVIKGSNEMLTGRIVRYNGAFLVIVGVDGRTIIVNAADVQMGRALLSRQSPTVTKMPH